MAGKPRTYHQPLTISGASKTSRVPETGRLAAGSAEGDPGRRPASRASTAAGGTPRINRRPDAGLAASGGCFRGQVYPPAAPDRTAGIATRRCGRSQDRHARRARRNDAPLAGLQWRLASLQPLSLGWPPPREPGAGFGHQSRPGGPDRQVAGPGVGGSQAGPGPAQAKGPWVLALEELCGAHSPVALPLAGHGHGALTSPPQLRQRTGAARATVTHAPPPGAGCSSSGAPRRTRSRPRVRDGLLGRRRPCGRTEVAPLAMHQAQVQSWHRPRRAVVVLPRSPRTRPSCLVIRRDADHAAAGGAQGSALRQETGRCRPRLLGHRKAHPASDRGTTGQALGTACRDQRPPGGALLGLRGSPGGAATLDTTTLPELRGPAAAALAALVPAMNRTAGRTSPGNVSGACATRPVDDSSTSMGRRRPPAYGRGPGAPVLPAAPCGAGFNRSAMPLASSSETIGAQQRPDPGSRSAISCAGPPASAQFQPVVGQPAQRRVQDVRGLDLIRSNIRRSFAAAARRWRG